MKNRQGQANHFLRFARERIPYAAQRYVGETERLYGVLDRRLADRDYVVGPGRGKYSIVDISLIGWVQNGRFSGVDTSLFPNINAWLDRVLARPAVQRGISIPFPPRNSNKNLAARLEAGEPGLKEAEEEKAAWLKKAQEQYSYKYTSP